MQLTDARILLGSTIEGGAFAGYVKTDAGVYGIVVGPKADCDAGPSKWGSYTDVPDARSFNDGLANTIAMAEAGSTLARSIRELRAGGFDDWYLPSRDELELLYRAFKPTEETNYVWRSGDNPSSLPPGFPYTEESPAQTQIAAFREGGAEAFEDSWYWSSTQYSRVSAWTQHFDGGSQSNGGKSYEGRARAVRRFKVE